MSFLKERLSLLFPAGHPAPWHFGVFYLFLALWMQGEALLNILWVVLLVISLPYLSTAFEVLKPYRWLWISIVAYLSLRLISLSYAIDIKGALYGLTDDLRIFTAGLLLLTYIRTGKHLKSSVIVTLIGFGVLAWHAFLLQWFTTHSLAAQEEVEFGSLAHVNYAAAFTSVVLFSLLVASRHVSKGWLIAIVLAALPLCVMQVPLGGRTTLILLAIAIIVYLVLRHIHRTSIFITLSSMLLIIVVLSQTENGLDQFKGTERPLEQASVYVRLDIWKTLFHVWEGSPMGIGPRGARAIDLNQHRDWIPQNVPEIATRTYGSWAMKTNLQGVDLNKEGHFVTDPHSHYVTLFVENGPLGLLAFLSYLLAAFVLAIKNLSAKNSWTSALSDIAVGSIFLMGGAAVMAAVFGQSGGIIMIMVIAFLVSSINIYKTEKD